MCHSLLLGHRSNVFSAIEILVSSDDEDVPKIALRTHQGHCEILILPFASTNVLTLLMCYLLILGSVIQISVYQTRLRDEDVPKIALCTQYSPRPL